MSDLRSRINSLSPAEKAELLDTVWESLVADRPTLLELRDRLRTRKAVEIPLDTAGLVRDGREPH